MRINKKVYFFYVYKRNILNYCNIQKILKIGECDDYLFYLLPFSENNKVHRLLYKQGFEEKITKVTCLISFDCNSL